MRATVAHLYQHALPRLRAVARCYVGDEAEDVVQDAFVNALRYGDAFRGNAAPLTWLHRIVVNASINHCRKRSRWRRTQLLADPPTTMTGAFDEALMLRTALGTLTPNQYRVLVMYDVLGYTHDEIATRLAIPSGTSKWRLAEARRRVRCATT